MRRSVLIAVVLVGAVGSGALIASRFWDSPAECSAPAADAAATYQRFLSLWTDPYSNEERRLRPMAEAEKREAWACLHASAEAGASEATYVLQVFYENGRAEFDLAPDYDLAEHYRQLTEKLRRAQ